MRKLFSEGDDLVIKDYILLGLSNDKVYIDSAHVLQDEVFGDNVLLCSCSNCKFENNDTPFEASLYIPVDVLLNHNKEYQVDNCIEFVDGPDMLTMQNTDLFDHTYELGNFWLNHIEGDLMGYKDDVYVTLELYIPTNFISKDEALQNEFLSVLINTKNGIDAECFRVPDITIPLVDIKELDDAKFKKYLQALVLKEMGNRCPDFYKKITGESFQVQTVDVLTVNMKNEDKGYYQKASKHYENLLHNMAQKERLSSEEVTSLAIHYNKNFMHTDGSIVEDSYRDSIKHMINDGLSLKNIKKVIISIDVMGGLDYKDIKQLHEILQEPEIKKMVKKAKNQSLTR